MSMKNALSIHSAERFFVFGRKSRQPVYAHIQRFGEDRQFVIAHLACLTSRRDMLVSEMSIPRLCSLLGFDTHIPSFDSSIGPVRIDIMRKRSITN